MAFQSKMRRARQAVESRDAGQPWAKTLEAPFPSAHQGFSVESKGRKLAGLHPAGPRSGRRDGAGAL
jgi:hypothetical protein